ncbi:MAG: glycosyltransferase family 2 protein [Bacteroidota bacterium]
MDLSVVIVSYKGYAKLNRCLESLASFTQNSFSMEVVVVNNNPGDELFGETETRFPGFRFVHNTVNGGYSNGCNLGCSKAAGEFFLILNPDTLVKEEEITRLLDAARSNPSYYILSCCQLKENGKESRAYGKFPWRRSSFAEPIENSIIFPDWVSGSVMIIHKDVYRRLNGFDEDFWMYYEDVDLCLRARNIGGKIAFYKDINIIHDHGASSRTDPRTTAMAKCEVQISRHLYIHKHEKGFRRSTIQRLIVLDNVITGIISGVAGLIFFFVPKLFVRSLLLIRLISYYLDSLVRRLWMSPRSVNYRKTFNA